MSGVDLDEVERNWKQGLFMPSTFESMIQELRLQRELEKLAWEGKSLRATLIKLEEMG